MLINILVYLLTLLIFLLFNENDIRFLLTFISYLLICELYKISYFKRLIYFLIAIFCVLTEIIFIKLFSNTWIYKNPNLLGIPFWLIPLWGIVILLIVNINKDIENIIKYIKKILQKYFIYI